MLPFMNKMASCLILTLMLASGCSRESLRLLSPPEIEKNPNESVPQGGILKCTASKPAAVNIHLDCNDHSYTLRYDSTCNSSEGLPVIGMKPGRTYHMRISFESGKEKLRYRKKLMFTTPDLPADPAEFPGFKATVLEQGRSAELLWTSRIPGETGIASFAMGDVDWLYHLQCGKTE
jgi:hypothetical protein